MKRFFLTTILVFMLSVLVIGPASAQKGKVNIKGEVIAVGDDGTLTILSNKGETFVVTVPVTFYKSTIKKGDSVLIKAIAGDGGTWLAQSIKQVGNGNNDDDKDENEADDKDQAEGSKDNSAYCADGKQEKPHPFAAKMAERYGVTEDWVMGYFCNGYGMGTIMLALRTSQIASQVEGLNADPDALLNALRDESTNDNGIGWGNLWKDLGLIGNEKNGQSPPGLLKKPDKKNK